MPSRLQTLSRLQDVALSELVTVDLKMEEIEAELAARRARRVSLMDNGVSVAQAGEHLSQVAGEIEALEGFLETLTEKRQSYADEFTGYVQQVEEEHIKRALQKRREGLMEFYEASQKLAPIAQKLFDLQDELNSDTSSREDITDSFGWLIDMAFKGVVETAQAGWHDFKSPDEVADFFLSEDRLPNNLTQFRLSQKMASHWFFKKDSDPAEFLSRRKQYLSKKNKKAA